MRGSVLLPFGPLPSLVWYAAIVLHVVLYGIPVEIITGGTTTRAGNARGIFGPSGDPQPGARLHAAPYASWVHGHWVRVDRGHQSSASVMQLLDEYQARGIPVRAVTLDAGWALRGTFRLNTTRFPDVPVTDGHGHGHSSVGFITALRRRGVRAVLYASSLIEEGTPAFATAVEQRYCLRRAGATSSSSSSPSDFLVKWHGGGSPDSPGAVAGCLVDHTDPDASRWWWSGVAADALAVDPDGFRLDAVDALVSQLGHTAVGRNGSAVTRAAWARLYYAGWFDFARARGAASAFDRVVSFRPVDSIEGSTFEEFGLPELSFACFIGNHPPTFAGLRASLMNAVHSSYHGFLNFGTTIGGTGVLTAAEEPTASQRVAAAMQHRELFVRWAQLGAFTPYMENGGLAANHAPWAVGCDAGVIDCRPSPDEHPKRNFAAHGLVDAAYRHAVRLHRALAPYFLSVATATVFDADDAALAAWAPRHGAVAHRMAKTVDDAALDHVPAGPAGEQQQSQQAPLPPPPPPPSPPQQQNQNRPSVYPPFYPMAREVHYDEPESFAFRVGRDVFVVPVVTSALANATASLSVANDSLPLHTYDVDTHLEVLTSTQRGDAAASVSFVPPAGDTWVDPTDGSAVYRGAEPYTVRRELRQGPLVLLRAGAVIPLGPEAGVIGWQLPPGEPRAKVPHRVSASPITGLRLRLDHPPLGPPAHHADHRKRGRTATAAVAHRGDHPEHVSLDDDAAAANDAMAVLLMQSPFAGDAVANGTTHSAAVHREHDNGVAVNVTVVRGTPGSSGLRLRVSAFAAGPVLIAIRGVRCVRCSAPSGFRLVQPDEFARLVEACVAHGVHAVDAQERLATIRVAEPTSDVLLFASAPIAGIDVLLPGLA